MPEFDILDKGGFDALSRSIGPEIKAPGRIAVGVLADANDDWRARWRAIADRLRSTGIEPPDVLDPGAGDLDAAKPLATTFNSWLRSVFG